MLKRKNGDRKINYITIIYNLRLRVLAQLNTLTISLYILLLLNIEKTSGFYDYRSLTIELTNKLVI